MFILQYNDKHRYGNTIMELETKSKMKTDMFIL